MGVLKWGCTPPAPGASNTGPVGWLGDWLGGDWLGSFDGCAGDSYVPGRGGGSIGGAAGAGSIGAPNEGATGTELLLAGASAAASGRDGAWDVISGRYAGVLAQPANPAAERIPTGSSRRNGLERSMSTHPSLAIHRRVRASVRRCCRSAIRRNEQHRLPERRRLTPPNRIGGSPRGRVPFLPADPKRESLAARIHPSTQEAERWAKRWGEVAVVRRLHRAEDGEDLRAPNCQRETEDSEGAVSRSSLLFPWWRPCR